MLEALKNLENVERLSRADSELTVATVDTFLSDTSVNNDTAVPGQTQPTEIPDSGNAENLVKKGYLYHFYYTHIGTIIIISK